MTPPSGFMVVHYPHTLVHFYASFMWGSRKPGGGGGSGTPGDSYLVGLARGQPGVGAHLAGAAPGVDPHCPGAGRLTFVPRFNVFLPPTLVTMRLPCSHKRECTGCSKNCEHGRQRYSCKECGGGGICEHGRRRYRCKDCGGSDHVIILEATEVELTFDEEEEVEETGEGITTVQAHVVAGPRGGKRKR